MRSLILVVVFIYSALMPTSVQAENGRFTHFLRDVTIYIDKKPPRGFTYSQWENHIIEACQAWFKDSGINIIKMNSPRNAEIVFVVRVLPNMVYGEYRSSNDYQFPHLPNMSDNVSILIHRDTECMEGSNIKRTLIHEVGHALGINHTTDSIVSAEWDKPEEMTPQDFERVKELKRYVDSFSVDVSSLSTNK